MSPVCNTDRQKSRTINVDQRRVVCIMKLSGRWNMNCFGKLMFKSNTLTWLLSAYLVLLLNLGPSLHRADILGYHSQGCCASEDFTSSKANINSCHCCQHAESPQQTFPGQQITLEKPGQHDCPFCKFFDQYHVVLVQIELPQPTTKSFVRTCPRLFEPNRLFLQPTARGPPALCRG